MALRNRVQLDIPGAAYNGGTLRQTLLKAKQIAAKVGNTVHDDRLDLKTDPPRAGANVWRVFNALSAARTMNSFGGYEPISYQEIWAWVQLYRQPLDTWELNALRAMDIAYIEEVGKLQRDGKE